MNRLCLRAAPVLVLCLPLGAFALAEGARPDDPAAAAPALRHASAFADYKPWQEIRPGNWRQLNDQLVAPAAGRAGGHGSHAMPAPPQGAAAHPPPAPAGHPMHGGRP